jgi:hypothetical protein
VTTPDVPSVIDGLNSLAGLAALLNGLLLWPIVRALKAGHQELHSRVGRLEGKRGTPKKRTQKRKPRAR